MVELMKRWLSSGMMLLPLFLLSVFVTMMVAGSSSKGSQARALPIAPPREPGIKMVGVNAEVTQESRPIQQIISRTARFSSNPDSRDFQTVLMDDIAIQFYNEQGKATGKANSPRGKIWLSDNKQTSAKRNDLMLLENSKSKVEYRDETQHLSTDSMFYYYSARRMVSGRFERYFRFDADCYVATGLKMEAQLTSDTMQFQRIRQVGKPVIIKEIDQKDMKP